MQINSVTSNRPARQSKLAQTNFKGKTITNVTIAKGNEALYNATNNALRQIHNAITQLAKTNKGVKVHGRCIADKPSGLATFFTTINIPKKLAKEETEFRALVSSLEIQLPEYVGMKQIDHNNRRPLGTDVKTRAKELKLNPENGTDFNPIKIIP